MNTILLNLLSISFTLKFIVCEISYEKLILESEKRFSVDAIANTPEEFTIFRKEEKSISGNNPSNIVFINKENNKDILNSSVIVVSTGTEPGRDHSVVIINKGEDGLHSKYSSTYIVLRKTESSPNLYTAHLVHLRNFNGTPDVEWDNYKPKVKRENINFVAAFTPYDFKLDSLVRTFLEDKRSKGRNTISIITDRPPVNVAPTTEEITSFSDLVHQAQNGNVPKEEKKMEVSPIFVTMEKILMKEVGKLQNETAVKKSLHNESESSKESHSHITVRLTCSRNSGAIIVGRKCVCPKGTLHLENKCVEQAKSDSQNSMNSTSKENVEAFVEKASSRLLDNFIPIKVKLYCPPNSGAILYKRTCICPEGTKLKDEICTPKVASQEIKDVDKNERNARNVAAKLKGKYASPVVISAKGKSAATTSKNLTTEKSILSAKGRSMVEILNNSISNSSTPENSQTEIFSGILSCQYHIPNETHLEDPSANMTAVVVDFYLITLRAQCYEEIRINSLRLFQMGIVTLGVNVRVDLNPEHEYMKSKTILTVLEWNDLVSGILLSIYSHAYQDQHKLLRDKGKAHSVSPDGKNISMKIQTLTLLIEKGTQFLKKELIHHVIKFINTLTSLLNERLLEVLQDKQHWVHNCKDCDKEHSILHQDENQIRLLLEYLKHITLPVKEVPIKHSTFAEFYLSQHKNISQINAKPNPITLGRTVITNQQIVKKP